jgi:hypothetical protein
MEVALQGIYLLSARRAHVQDKMIGQGEGGRRRRHRNHKLPSGCHRLILYARLFHYYLVEMVWACR